MMIINKMKPVCGLTFLCIALLLSSCSSVDETLPSAEDLELESIKQEALTWSGPADDPNAVVYLSTDRDYSQEILDEVAQLEKDGKPVIYMTDSELNDMFNGDTAPETVSNRDIDCVYSAFAGILYYPPSEVIFYHGSITSMDSNHWWGVAIYGCGSPFYMASDSGDFYTYSEAKQLPCNNGTWANNRVVANCGFGWELGDSMWHPL